MNKTQCEKGDPPLDQAEWMRWCGSDPIDVTDDDLSRRERDILSGRSEDLRSLDERKIGFPIRAATEKERQPLHRETADAQVYDLHQLTRHNSIGFRLIKGFNLLHDFEEET